MDSGTTLIRGFSLDTRGAFRVSHTLCYIPVSNEGSSESHTLSPKISPPYLVGSDSHSYRSFPRSHLVLFESRALSPKVSPPYLVGSDSHPHRSFPRSRLVLFESHTLSAKISPANLVFSDTHPHRSFPRSRLAVYESHALSPESHSTDKQGEYLGAFCKVPPCGWGGVSNIQRTQRIFPNS